MRSFSVSVSGWVRWWVGEGRCPSSSLSARKRAAAGEMLLFQLMFGEECAAPAAFSQLPLWALLPLYTECASSQSRRIHRETPRSRSSFSKEPIPVSFGDFLP